MTGQDWVLIIGSLSTAITAIMTTLVLLLRRDVKDVHTLVNSQHTDEIAYRQVLTDALKVAGVRVPVDKSIEVKDAK